jgi:hypothetical protein
MDRGFGPFAGGHPAQEYGTQRQPQPISTDLQCYSIRENVLSRAITPNGLNDSCNYLNILDLQPESRNQLLTQHKKSNASATDPR